MLSLSLFLSLIGEEGVYGHALSLQGCTHPLHQSERERKRVRERERKRVREREKERERGRKREREKERKREREREREMKNMSRILFLKGMTGALAP
jgi:hypothetical protein